MVARDSLEEINGHRRGIALTQCFTESGKDQVFEIDSQSEVGSLCESFKMAFETAGASSVHNKFKGGVLFSTKKHFPQSIYFSSCTELQFGMLQICADLTSCLTSPFYIFLVEFESMSLPFAESDASLFLNGEPQWKSRLGEGWKGTKLLGKGGHGVGTAFFPY